MEQTRADACAAVAGPPGPPGVRGPEGPRGMAGASMPFYLPSMPSVTISSPVNVNARITAAGCPPAGCTANAVSYGGSGQPDGKKGGGGATADKAGGPTPASPGKGKEEKAKVKGAGKAPPEKKEKAKVKETGGAPKKGSEAVKGKKPAKEAGTAKVDKTKTKDSVKDKKIEAAGSKSKPSKTSGLLFTSKWWFWTKAGRKTWKKCKAKGKDSPFWKENKCDTRQKPAKGSKWWWWTTTGRKVWKECKKKGDKSPFWKENDCEAGRFVFLNHFVTERESCGACRDNVTWWCTCWTIEH